MTVAGVAAVLVEGSMSTAAGPWHALRLLKNPSTAPGGSLCMTACEVRLYLNFICNPGCLQTSSNLHRWPLAPKSKNNKKLAIPSLPFSLGRCAAAHFGRRTVCTTTLHPLPSCVFTLPTLWLAGG